MECVPQGLPSQGRWLGEAETERSQQICDNLSVTFGDSIPTPFVPSGHFPLIGGIGPWKGSLGWSLSPQFMAEEPDLEGDGDEEGEQIGGGLAHGDAGEAEQPRQQQDERHV